MKGRKEERTVTGGVYLLRWNRVHYVYKIRNISLIEWYIEEQPSYRSGIGRSVPECGKRYNRNSDARRVGRGKVDLDAGTVVNKNDAEIMRVYFTH